MTLGLIIQSKILTYKSHRVFHWPWTTVMMIDLMSRSDQDRQMLSKADSQLNPPRNPRVIASFIFSATRKVTQTLGSTRTSPGPIPL